MGYCIAQTSLAHTYGNMTCFIADYIKNLFPENYFKTVHISSAIAYKQFNIFQNKNKEFIKKSKPMLIIRPRVEISESDVYLYNTLLTARFNDMYMMNDFGNLQDFFDDRSKDVHIKYLLNRLRLMFDITIITETQIDQLNQAHYLKNRLRHEKPFILTTALESYIPRELMQTVSEISGVPMYDSNNNIKNFLDYINTNSIYPVSYKMKNSTGNDEFFRFYPANIFTVLSGLNIDDGSKKGMVFDAHTISFTVLTEFNASGLYYVFSDGIKDIRQIVGDIVDKNQNRIIPLFTINNYEEKLADGWVLYASPIFAVDTNHGYDEMDISSLFNNSLYKLIEHHVMNGMPIHTFMNTRITKDNRELIPGRDYKIDYEKMKLYTNNPNMDSTYRFVIHVNTLYVNTMIKDLLDLEKER